MRVLRFSACLLSIPLVYGCAPEPFEEVVSEPLEALPPAFGSEEQASHTDARLQSVFAVDERVVWASGLEGTYAVTEDGGATWHSDRVAGAEDLQFRDVHAFDRRTAFLLSAGEGEQSRIFKTEDGGESWTLQYVNLEPDGFLDCFGFWDRDHGLVYGDSVGGDLFLLATANGGTTWERVAGDVLPPAGQGEGGFAASGTCVQAADRNQAWIGTGAGGNARLLMSRDRGSSWLASEVPMVTGDAAGVFSVLPLPGGRGLAVGGDLSRSDEHTDNVAVTEDSGQTWGAGGRLRFAGPAYGSTWLAREVGPVLIVVGPGGVDFSTDWGFTWEALADGDYWGADAGGPGVFWAVGPDGRITRFDLQ